MSFFINNKNPNGGGGSGSDHTHSNLVVLNKFKEVNGELLYNNLPIQGAITSISASNVAETTIRQFVTETEKTQIGESNLHISKMIHQEEVHGMRVTNGKFEYFDGLGWIEVQGGSSIALPISANDVTETSAKQFLTANQKAQITSNTTELESHSLRLNDLENATPVASTDEMVKLNAVDTTSGYLEDKVNEDTLRNQSGKLTVVGVEGLTAQIYELNQLTGIVGNVQAQLNALTGVGNFTGTADTYADITIVNPDPQMSDMIIVVEDENHDNDSTIYVYDGNSWIYSGKFTATVRDFVANPLDLVTETTSILPKVKYEKQNASDTPILNASNYFQAQNVEEALIELFQYTNSLRARIAAAVGHPLNASDTVNELETKILAMKALLATSITGKGVPAYPYNTLSEMANKISAIPNVAIDGLVKQTDRFNATAPYTYNLVLEEPLSIKDIATTVLEYVGNDTGVIHYQSNFNISDANNFTYDANGVTFDGFMNIRDEWKYGFKDIGDDIFETSEIDFGAYAEIEEINVDENAIFKGIQSTQEVIKQANDVSLLGVETIDKILLSANTSGSGVNKLAVSFDSGISWHAWNGQTWIVVNVNDKADFKNNGMTPTVADSLTDVEIGLVRQDSDLVRLAYYLERPSYIDIAKNDKIDLSVTMQGIDTIANTNDYSYDYNPVTKTLSFVFSKSGIFQVNYVDGE